MALDHPGTYILRNDRSTWILPSASSSHDLFVGRSICCLSQGSLAFGAKGRPSSPGKPRIPGDATITFDVEMVGLPGKEPELIELIGDF